MKIRRVELPKMPETDLKDAVRWQLRDVVDGAVSDYVVRYSLIDEFQSNDVKRLSLLAYAVKREPVEAMTETLKKLSLFPLAIEPTAVSLLAAFDRLHGWVEGEYYGLINLGESQSFFTAMSEGKLLFSRPLVGISGREFREGLEKSLGQDSNKGDLQDDRSDMPSPGFHTRIAIEVQKSIDNFVLMYRKERIHNLYLCGGGATLPGLVESLAKNLAVPTDLLDPASKFQIDEGQGPALLYDVALGLALYEP